ncbi:MAG: hypothetical protein Kow0013_21890 [Pararhodobacter sp.]
MSERVQCRAIGALEAPPLRAWRRISPWSGSCTTPEIGAAPVSKHSVEVPARSVGKASCATVPGTSPSALPMAFLMCSPVCVRGQSDTGCRPGHTKPRVPGQPTPCHRVLPRAGLWLKQGAVPAFRATIDPPPAKGTACAS